MNGLLPLLLLGLGCPACRSGPQLELLEQQAAAPAPVPAGRVEGGRFIDDRFGFSVAVPEPWVATPGPDTGALRVGLDDPETGTRVEIWAFAQLGDQPRPRGDCTWTFLDDGRFRSAGRAERTTTATCTPDDPASVRVFAWLFPGPAVGYQAEVHVPPSSLVEGRRRGEAVVRTLTP